MCSIIGFLGHGSAAPLLYEALKRMEYRGYDSAGVATLSDGSIIVKKDVGRVADVGDRLKFGTLPGRLGIGHTRWATHGGVTCANAHPHLSGTGRVAIVHNGIIDNYADLKQRLIDIGYTFKSQTDSEVIANLLDFHLSQSMDVKRSMVQTLSQLKGKYAFIALFDNGTLAAARLHEPLVVGIARNGIFVASDIMGFVEHTDEVLYMDNGEFATVTSNGIAVSDFREEPVKHQVMKVSKEFADAKKGSYVHYTLKEIHEQPQTISRAGGESRPEVERVAELIRDAKSVYLTGSGTSYHAALLGKFILAKYAGKKVDTIIASEMEFSPVKPDSESVLVAISQSGESADVIESVNIAKRLGATTVAMVNVTTSSLARLCSQSIGLNCGPEIGVAATKSFTAQLAVIYRLARALNASLGVDLENLPMSVSAALSSEQDVSELARRISTSSDVYVLGMGIHYFVALEASLKIKELSYVHAEALPSGELKHGPLALIDSNVFVIAINPSDSTYLSTLTSVHEVKARGAKVIGVSDRPHESYDYWVRIPPVDEALFPVVEIVPLQQLAYHAAVWRKANPDYPRNLAKSVTVK